MAVLAFSPGLALVCCGGREVGGAGDEHRGSGNQLAQYAAAGTSRAVCKWKPAARSTLSPRGPIHSSDLLLTPSNFLLSLTKRESLLVTHLPPTIQHLAMRMAVATGSGMGTPITQVRAAQAEPRVQVSPQGTS